MQADNAKPIEADAIITSEKQHLKGVLDSVVEAIALAQHLVDHTEDAYHDMKSYMSGYRGEIDPSEQYQNELHLNDVDRQSAEAAEAKDRLEKLLDSPYFARVDFADRSESDPRAIYIGRFSFNYESKSLISDWRSPVAALFYDFDLGDASYVAPAGLVCGTLVGKRQFEIQGGELKYAVDSGSSVRDEVLQHELSKTSDQKMKSIISSIQREQNSIIRDEGSGSLVIQGVAGSGKTSIALHRVAYLLYRHKDKLTSNSIAILSPNKVFGDYISTVLPELGEEPIKELYLEDLFEHVLGSSLVIERPRSFVDDTDEAWRSRAQYKGSIEFAEQVRGYLDESMTSVFVGESLAFGRHAIEGPWIEKRFYGYENMSVADRIEAVASDIVLDLNSQYFKIGSHAMPTKGVVRAGLMRMLRAKDALSLYRRFFVDLNKKEQFKVPKKGVIEWEDAAPLVLFDAFYKGVGGFADIGHLVIDEMQDLTPVQHMMMNRLFACEKTILGDYHQMIDPGNVMNLERMKAFYAEARIIELKRSYRSTCEIMELAKRVKNIPEIESIARHGAEPEIVRCDNTAGVLKRISAAIVQFESGEHKTLGIIHRSEELAKRYFELLSRDHCVHFLSSDSTAFENGVSVSSIKMAKGLEFDEVLVIDVDESQYISAYDRNLLYVAITRAMHKLTLLYRAEQAAFLRTETPDQE